MFAEWVARAKLTLREKPKLRKALGWGILACFVVGFVIAALAESQNPTVFNVGLVLFGVGFYGGLLFLALARRSSTEARLESLDRKEETLRASLAAPDAEPPLAKRVEIHLIRTDKFYTEILGQAQRSFTAALVLAIVGTVVIFVGVGIAYFKFNSRDLATTTLAAFPGIVLNALSAGIFLLHKTTIRMLPESLARLTRTQDVMFAIEVVESIPENDKKAAAKERLLEGLISGSFRYRDDPKP